MLFIDPNSPNVKKALHEHYKAIRCLIWKRIGKDMRCNNPKCLICSSGMEYIEGIPSKLKEYLYIDDVLKELICGNPKELFELNNFLIREIFGDIIFDSILVSLQKKKKDRNDEDKFYILHYKNQVQIISKIVDYEGWFVKKSPTDYYSAYHLAENLNRRSCTYCNRIYTNTMVTPDNKKLMRPQFDHWFPKSKYPLLALSFYNLIPSCSICNSSSKGDTELLLDKHIHPYIDTNQTSDFKFKYSYEDKLDKYNICIESVNGCDKSKDTLEKLEVHTMYNAHHSELSDLIKIKEAYSEDYISKIMDLFEDSDLKKEEIYRMLFGTEMDEKDFHKRPMSKFKHDILKDLGII